MDYGIAACSGAARGADAGWTLAWQADLDRLVARIPSDAPVVQCVHALLPARAVGDDIHIQAPDGGGAACVVPLLRQQTRDCLSLADFLSEDDGDSIGVFACACHVGERCLAGDAADGADDEYHQVLLKALAARLVEAAAELLHQQMRRRWNEHGVPELSPAEMLQVLLFAPPPEPLQPLPRNPQPTTQSRQH